MENTIFLLWRMGMLFYAAKVMQMKLVVKMEEKTDLDKLVEWMNKHTDLNVSIEGHTSTLGKADYNLKLSEKRAQKTVNYLVSKGIDKNRLKAVGFGEQFPVGDNSTEEGRVQSRRVVMRIAQ